MSRGGEEEPTRRRGVGDIVFETRNYHLLERLAAAHEAHLLAGLHVNMPGPGPAWAARREQQVGFHFDSRQFECGHRHRRCVTHDVPEYMRSCWRGGSRRRGI